MIFMAKKNEGRKRQVDETHSVTNLITKDISKNVSLAVVDAKSHSSATKSKRSDRIYYVVKGKLTVKDKKKHVALPGGAIYIKKSTQYNLSGTFKALVINAPPFDIRYEGTLK